MVYGGHDLTTTICSVSHVNILALTIQTLVIRDSYKWFTCTDSCDVEARAADWDWRAKVKVGESQGAEDGLGVEGGEEPDEDEAGEQDEGGGEHGGLEQGLTKLFLWAPNRGGEEGEGT